MKYKKVIIKIGTSALAKNGSIDDAIIENIASEISMLLEENIKVVLVSSGAIGAGLGLLGLKKRPASLSELQAIAAVGQNELMRFYSQTFKKRGYVVGQVLLTQEDFSDRRRYLNIKYTLDTLISKKIIPIVNENDTVSTEEIKCGDNDRLSSLVADLLGADALVILTDVDGFYDKEGKVMPLIQEVTGSIKKMIENKATDFTKGGMATKIEAAERAIHSGIDCYIANGKKTGIIKNALLGKATCTYFKAKPIKEKAKKRWIAYSSKIKGKIIIDDGARDALLKRQKSLLASGIVGKDGNFKAGEVVTICDSKKNELARGLTSYSSKEIERIKGLKTAEIEKMLGYKDHDEVVHRDNLVIL
ncbi:MAG: glutamate 5-kinase [Candidatus Omnitrophota bacterium]